MKFRKSDPESEKAVVKALKEKKVVIIPTDTVYGFSGIVPETDALIRKIKGRAETKPFIQLIASPEELLSYTDQEVPAALLEKWPGALTIIVRNKPGMLQETTAYRCPGDAWLRRIISAAGCPVYSTSVNRSGSPVLDEIDAIEREFGSEAAVIVDDGAKKGALPSTLVSILDGKITVLRQGSVQV